MDITEAEVESELRDIGARVRAMWEVERPAHYVASSMLGSDRWCVTDVFKYGPDVPLHVIPGTEKFKWVYVTGGMPVPVDWLRSHNEEHFEKSYPDGTLPPPLAITSPTKNALGYWENIKPTVASNEPLVCTVCLRTGRHVKLGHYNTLPSSAAGWREVEVKNWWYPVCGWPYHTCQDMVERKFRCYVDLADELLKQLQSSEFQLKEAQKTCQARPVRNRSRRRK